MNGINLILIIPVLDTNKQNHRLTDFVESRINNSTLFHIPLISLKQVVKDLKNIPDNKAKGLDGIGIKPWTNFQTLHIFLNSFDYY